MKRSFVAFVIAFCATSVHAEADFADFPSDDWKNAPMDWFIQWKRVRKYTRIAAVTHQEHALDPLARQARQLYLQIWRWPDGSVKNICYPSADRLKAAVDALASGRSDGMELLSLSGLDGERCFAAIQTEKKR